MVGFLHASGLKILGSHHAHHAIWELQVYSLRFWRLARLSQQVTAFEFWPLIFKMMRPQGWDSCQVNNTIFCCSDLHQSISFKLRNPNTIFLWLMQTLVSSLLRGIPCPMLPTNSPLVMAALGFVREYSFVARKVGMLLYHAAFDQSYFVQGTCTCICISISRS